MGSYDGAEVCEIVGLYLLEKLSTLIDKKKIGLYRDDGLSVIDNANGPKLDRLRKDIIRIFKSEGLNITIETNLSVTDFLDVTLDLSMNKFYPYRKPNDKPIYINANSNHPPSVLKSLPSMINKGVSDLSSDSKEFERAKGLYQEALKTSGFESNLNYIPQNEKNKKRNRRRKIIWFNPPYNANVKNNIGKEFLKIVSKNFPKNHRLSKIFNRNTIKLSYGCTQNVENIIKQHNAKLLNEVDNQQARLCNCHNKETCPLDGKCLSTCIIYKAEVKTPTDTSVYYGASEGEFKFRYNNHTKSFRLRRYENDSELSKLIWKLKDDSTPYSLKWSISANAIPYKCGSRSCDLCTTEKVTILRAEPKGLLNKRTELMSKCRHKNKFIINSVK